MDFKEKVIVNLEPGSDVFRECFWIVLEWFYDWTDFFTDIFGDLI